MADELQLDASRRLAEPYTPAQAAAALEANQTLGVPIEVAIRSPTDVFNLRSRVDQIPSSEINKLSPALAAYMTNPWNAAVVKEDVKPLMDFEMATDPSLVESAVKSFGSRSNQLVGNLMQAVASVTDVLGAAESAARYPGGEGLQGGKETNLLRDVSEWLRTTGADVEKAGEDYYRYIPKYTFDRMLANPSPSNIAGLIIEQGVGSVPDMLGAALALPAYAPALAQEMAAQRAKNNGGGEVDLVDLAAMLPVSVALSMIDQFSTKGMFGVLADQATVRTAGQIAKEAGKSAVRESGTEFVQEYGQYAAETAGTNKGFSALDALTQGLEGAFVGAGLGGAVRTTTATAQAVQNRSSRGAVKRFESELRQGKLDDQLSALAQVKLRQTSPPKFSEYIRAATTGKNLYLDPDVLTKVDMLGEALPNLRTAANDGTDIPISYEDVASVLDKPEVMSVLRPHLKTSIGTYSTAELENQDAALAELVQREAIAKREQSSLDKLHERAVEEMVATGRLDRSSAAWTAETITSYLATAQARLAEQGVEVSIDSLASDMGLRIERMAQPTQGAMPQEPIVRQFEDESGNTVEVTMTPEQALADIKQRRDNLKKLLKCVAGAK